MYHLSNMSEIMDPSLIRLDGAFYRSMRGLPVPVARNFLDPQALKCWHQWPALAGYVE